MTTTQTNPTTPAITLWCLPEDITRKIAVKVHTPDIHELVQKIRINMNSKLEELNHNIDGLSHYAINIVRNSWDTLWRLYLNDIVKDICTDPYVEYTPERLIDIFGMTYAIDFEMCDNIMGKMYPIVGCQYNCRYELADDGRWRCDGDSDDDSYYDSDSDNDDID
tara:strand:- start:42 stop:536 length:495 start_codon:yes stop_codon:yes gene_type:complete